MDIKLVVDGFKIPVGYELLETIVDRIGDHEELQDFYHKMVESRNPDVLYAIAYYDNLRADTIKILLDVGEMRVVERVLNSSERIAKVSKEQILEVLEKYHDTEVFKAVASNFESINVENPNEILDTILDIAKDNLAVIGAIADGYDIPTYILKKLANHSDIDISRKAKGSLE